MSTTPTLRQRLKQETRREIERAALALLARQGYQETSVEQIVRLAGTTRTTFYDHFRGKSDLIAVVQEHRIAPALIELCERLDAHDPITRESLRAWLLDYSRTWRRIKVLFDAYNDASRSDPAVAATMLPNSFAVTGHMTRFLGHFTGGEQVAAHYKLVLLFNDLDQLMHVTSLMRDPEASSRMFDTFTDLYWRGLFDLSQREGDGGRRTQQSDRRPVPRRKKS